MNGGLRRRWSQRPMSQTTPSPASRLGFDVTVPFGYARAVTAVRDALKAEGFGVLTEIDITAAFREKLGKDFRPYTILGACNPPLAFAALSADPVVGLLLPCNVTVEAVDDGHSLVRLIDPEVMLAMAPGKLPEAVNQVARDAHGRIVRVTDALKALATRT
jgi:uncharacterized protein (DUF302 family)